MTWLDLCKDKNLQDLPYRLELSREGKIVMSPTRNRHGYLQSRIARVLGELMSTGETLVECAIETEDATKVADVVWVSDERFRIIKDEASCSVAPEICIEVLSPFNTEEEMARKRELYLRAGAKECWLCDEDGRTRFFDAGGLMKKSVLCPEFPARLSV